MHVKKGRKTLVVPDRKFVFLFILSAIVVIEHFEFLYYFHLNQSWVSLHCFCESFKTVEIVLFFDKFRERHLIINYCRLDNIGSDHTVALFYWNEIGGRYCIVDQKLYQLPIGRICAFGEP